MTPGFRGERTQEAIGGIKILYRRKKSVPFQIPEPRPYLILEIFIFLQPSNTYQLMSSGAI